MKKLKLFVKNHKGTIYRIDKMGWLKKKLPTATDISRRIILCQQNSIPFKPFELFLEKGDWEKLKSSVGDKQVFSDHYMVVSDESIYICKIIGLK